MRFSLRTLLIVMAIAPPVLAACIFSCIAARESALADQRRIEQVNAREQAELRALLGMPKTASQ